MSKCWFLPGKANLFKKKKKKKNSDCVCASCPAVIFLHCQLTSPGCCKDRQSSAGGICS